jgi:hypothetical protein
MFNDLSNVHEQCERVLSSITARQSWLAPAFAVHTSIRLPPPSRLIRSATVQANAVHLPGKQS